MHKQIWPNMFILLHNLIQHHVIKIHEGLLWEGWASLSFLSIAHTLFIYTSRISFNQQLNISLNFLKNIKNHQSEFLPLSTKYLSYSIILIRPKHA